MPIKVSLPQRDFARQLGSINPTPPPASSAPNRAAGQTYQAITNWVATFKLAADNTPTQIIGVIVPAGKAVHVRANNGTTAGNAQVIFVSEHREDFALGFGTPLAPLDDVVWPTNNLNKIWIYGKTGDGVVVSITTPPGF